MKVGVLFVVWTAGAMAQYGGDRLYDSSRKPIAKVDSQYYSVQQDYGYDNTVYSDSRDGKQRDMVDVRLPKRQEMSKSVEKQGAPKSVEKYGPYGKSSYGQKTTSDVNGYDRKKMNRAAQHTVYKEGSKPKGTTQVPFKAVSQRKWNQEVFIGCNTDLTSKQARDLGYDPVGGYGTIPSYYPTEPVYQDLSYNQFEPSYPAAYHGYEQYTLTDYYSPSPAPSNANSPDDHSNVVQGGEYLPGTYYHDPPVYYEPSQPDYYQGYETYPLEYYPPPPPPESAGHPYGAGSLPASAEIAGPSYKSAVDEQAARFAAPVREKLAESPKAPVISAFHKPAALESVSTTTQKSPGPKAPGNGTVVEQPTTSSTPNPKPETVTVKPNDDYDEFWSGESPAENVTDVAEGSTVQ